MEIHDGPSIATIVVEGGGVVYETDRDSFVCDVHKEDKSAMVIAEIHRGNRSIFRFTAPPGIRIMRLDFHKHRVDTSYPDAP